MFQLTDSFNITSENSYKMSTTVSQGEIFKLFCPTNSPKPKGIQFIAETSTNIHIFDWSDPKLLISYENRVFCDSARLLLQQSEGKLSLYSKRKLLVTGGRTSGEITCLQGSSLFCCFYLVIY